MESVSRLCLVADARRRENNATAKKIFEKLLQRRRARPFASRIHQGPFPSPLVASRPPLARGFRRDAPRDARRALRLRLGGRRRVLRGDRGHLPAASLPTRAPSFERENRRGRACGSPREGGGFRRGAGVRPRVPAAPPTEDGLTAPAAWHPSRPILATVDGEGQLLIHHDPARESLGTPAGARRAPAASAAALRHASHPRARARVAPARGRDSRRRRGGTACACGRGTQARPAPSATRRRRTRLGGPKHARARARLAAVAHPPPSRRLRRRAARRGERDPFRHAGVSTGLANAARAFPKPHARRRRRWRGSSSRRR